MGHEGYIKLSRKLLDWKFFWADHSVVQLFVYILLSANYTDKKIGQRLIRRGQCLTTIRTLSEISGWSHNTVSKYMKTLVDDGCISVVSDKTRGTGGTLITVINYDKYQSCVSDCDTQSTDEDYVCVSDIDTQNADEGFCVSSCVSDGDTQNENSDVCVSSCVSVCVSPGDTKQEYKEYIYITTTNTCVRVEKNWMQDIIERWRNDINFSLGMSEELMIPNDTVRAGIDSFSIKIDNEKYSDAHDERELVRYFKNFLRMGKRERETNGGYKKFNSARDDKQTEHALLVQRTKELFARGKSECGEVPF